ncbi:MAG: hypothetical protein FWE55_02540 [Synergistaceae bacterium]|nr:hypothetical protein [Synergistaceae bacterium]
MDCDVDRLIDIVTREIIKRLGESEKECVLVTDGCPEGMVSEDYDTVRGSDSSCCKYVLLTEAAYRALAGGTDAVTCCRGEQEPICDGSVDLRGKRLLHERDLRDHNVGRDTVVRVSKNTIVTALAHDYAKGLGTKIIKD